MNNHKNKLRAIVIVKNEEKRLGKCLGNLNFADEIVVIDNNSTDSSVVVAGKFTSKVYISDGLGFADLRNLAMQKTSFDWLLYIDCDETPDEDLKKQIIAAVNRTESKIVAYRIIRRNFYLGQLWPKTEPIIRLIKKSSLRGWFGKLHESPDIRGEIGDLSGFLDHDTHRSLSEMVEKTNEWSKIEAELRLAQNHPPVVWWRLVRVMFTGFYRSLITDGGYKAGTVGLIESIFQGFSMFVTYAKLWEMQKQNNENK